MPNYDYTLNLANAQADEFEKIAVSLSSPWAGRIAGALLGGAGGGALGAATAPPEQRTLGTVRGALFGAGAGLLGGQFATRAGRQQAQRFGQRQLHGVTGYLPGRGLVGRGTEGTKWWQLGARAQQPLTKAERVAKLKAMKMDVPERLTQQEARKRVREGTVGRLLGIGETQTGARVQDWMARRMLATREARRRLAESGMTSLPGLARGYAGRAGMSPLEAAKLNITAPGMAMGAVLPAAMAAQSGAELAQTGDVRQFAQGLGETAGWTLAGGMPIGASMALGTLAGKGGEALGYGVERLRNRPQR